MLATSSGTATVRARCAVLRCSAGKLTRPRAVLEHEDSDMMRPLRTCAPRGPLDAPGQCRQARCVSPLSAVTYDTRTGETAL